MIARRSFLTGLAAAFTAPAIVHAGNLMPVKMMDPYHWRFILDYYIGTDTIALRADCSTHSLADLRSLRGCTRQINERQASRLFPNKPWRKDSRMYHFGMAAWGCNYMNLEVSPSYGDAADEVFMSTLASDGPIVRPLTSQAVMSSGLGSTGFLKG